MAVTASKLDSLQASRESKDDRKRGKERDSKGEKQTARQRVRAREAIGESYPSRWLYCQGQ